MIKIKGLKLEINVSDTLDAFTETNTRREEIIYKEESFGETMIIGGAEKIYKALLNYVSEDTAKEIVLDIFPYTWPSFDRRREMMRSKKRYTTRYVPDDGFINITPFDVSFRNSIRDVRRVKIMTDGVRVVIEVE